MASAMVQVNVRIDPALYARAKRRAKSEKRTMTDVVNAALEQYVDGKGKQGK